MTAVASAKLGDWANGSDPERGRSKEDNDAIEAVQRHIYEVLSTGGLTAYVEVVSTGNFYRVPVEYWREDGWWSARLANTMFDFDAADMPRAFQDQPIWFFEEDVKRFLQFETSAARRVAKQRKTKYPWAAFEAEAVEQLEQEGDFRTDWIKADLEERMRTWCEKQGWDKVPSESDIRAHVTKAHAQFLQQRAEI
jgi:hypothetical protein